MRPLILLSILLAGPAAASPFGAEVPEAPPAPSREILVRDTAPRPASARPDRAAVAPETAVAPQGGDSWIVEVQWPTLRADASGLLDPQGGWRFDERVVLDLDSDGHRAGAVWRLHLDVEEAGAPLGGAIPITVRLGLEQERAPVLRIEEKALTRLIVEGPSERGTVSRVRATWTTTLNLEPGRWFDLSTPSQAGGALPIPLRIRLRG